MTGRPRGSDISPLRPRDFDPPRATATSVGQRSIELLITLTKSSTSGEIDVRAAFDPGALQVTIDVEDDGPEALRCF